MEIRVVCPGCRAVLRVPPTAAGQVARCPHCQGRFLVPNEKEVIEDTISSWIEEDIDDMQDQLEQEWSKRHELEESQRREREEQKRAKTANRMEQFLSGKGQAPAPSSPAPTADESAAQQRPATPTQRPAAPPQPEHRTAGAWQPTGKDEKHVNEPAVGEAVEEHHDEDDVIDAHHYPQGLLVDPAKPNLVINQCSQEGVLIAFDSACMQDIGFRTSIPVACAFSGERNKSDLIAKPLAFVDQSQATIRNPQEIEAGHERKMTESDTPESLIAQMDIIKGLPERFQKPMPYYVAADHATLSLECRTKNRKDGGSTCFVVIPEGTIALQWLAAVNGTCGAEYRMLRNDVARLWSKQWQGVPEDIRQRIGAWAGFTPGERFRYYINDGEFGKKDEGMAGLIFTDRRIIYHRYHRSGEALYLENPQLIVRPEGDFAGVSIKTDLNTVKTVQLRISDLERLREIAAACEVPVDLRKQ